MIKEDRVPFFGTTVVGERGQVVVPKEARDVLKLKTGDRLIVLAHEHGMGMIPMDQAHELLAQFQGRLENMIK